MNFLEHAKRLEMYGISLHPGKVSSLLHTCRKLAIRQFNCRKYFSGERNLGFWERNLGCQERNLGFWERNLGCQERNLGFWERNLGVRSVILVFGSVLLAV